jgi:tetratricopeptide (TPR) repeat protein
MKTLLLILTLAGAGLSALSQHHHPAPAVKSAQPNSLMSGLGKHQHQVATKNAQAQALFNQGLTLVYGFNHPEAIRSFQSAAQQDPQLAMAWWGIALATGPNYNETEIDSSRRMASFEAIRKATSLMAGAPEHEQAYISALARRFAADANANPQQLAVDYSQAMAALVQRYPDDLDAATLYADSKMILHAWKLWSPEGKPAEGTEEAVQVLESVLARDPEHIGANHLYIHAVEASPRPERALASANRLAALTPAAGHLVHMPAHIYMRLGDYEAAARSNDQAAKADRVYIENTGAQGIYPAIYYSHNLHFLAAAYSMQGRFGEAKKAAEQLEANIGTYLKDISYLDGFMPTSTFLLVRFRRWTDLLKTPEPDKKLPITNALWHWGRGMAFAATRRPKDAATEQAVFTDALKAIPAETLFGANRAGDVLKVAGYLLEARIAAARDNTSRVVALLQEAVAAEDALAYSEPPDWYYPPTRESLGGALLREKRYKEAEAVFRADLARNRRNGRSLFGLLESLKAQHQQYAAQLVQREYEAAWRQAEVELRVEDL